MIQFKPYLVSVFVCLAFLANAQKDVDDNAEWMDRIYFGGGGGFSGGQNSFGRYFYFSVSPVVGYMLTSNASVGTGLVYQRTSYVDQNINFTQYGITPFIRYNFDKLFLIAEFNYINTPAYSFNGKSERVFRSRMLLGAGYSVPAGSRVRVNAMALYDVLYRQPSVFTSPWVFRVFFSF